MHLTHDKRGDLVRISAEKLKELLSLSESVFNGLITVMETDLYSSYCSIFKELYPNEDAPFWIDHKNTEILGYAKNETLRKVNPH